MAMITAVLDVNYLAPRLQLQDEIEKRASLHLTSAGRLVSEKPELILAKKNKQLKDGRVAGGCEDAGGRVGGCRTERGETGIGGNKEEDHR